MYPDEFPDSYLPYVIAVMTLQYFDDGDSMFICMTHFCGYVNFTSISFGM